MKLWASKVVGVLILKISRLLFEGPKTKCHLGVVPVARHIVYYKGEGDGFSQIQAVVNLVNLSLPVIHPCTKSTQIMH
jgi:hypothetical protein